MKDSTRVVDLLFYDEGDDEDKFNVMQYLTTDCYSCRANNVIISEKLKFLCGVKEEVVKEETPVQMQ